MKTKRLQAGTAKIRRAAHVWNGAESFILVLLAGVVMFVAPTNIYSQDSAPPGPVLVVRTPEIVTPVITTPPVYTPLISTPVITSPPILVPVITTPPVTTPPVTSPAITSPAITSPE